MALHGYTSGAPNDNFRKITCSEYRYDLRYRIFASFIEKFIACLPLLGFPNFKKIVELPIFNGFLPQKGHLEFPGAFFLAEIFEKINFDPCNFRITILSARKS